MILLGYIFVLLLRAFGPFCILKTVFKVFSLTASNQERWSFALVAFDAGRAADVYFAIEGLFYIYLSSYLKHYYNFSVTPLSFEDQRFPKERRKKVFQRFFCFLKRIGKDEGQLFVSNWFLGCDYNLLGRENVLEFVAFAFFKADSIDKLDANQRIEAEEYLANILSVCGAVQKCYNSDAVSMRHSLDPILPHVREHPLVLYIVVRIFLGIFCGRFLLWYYGFRCFPSKYDQCVYVKTARQHPRGEFNATTSNAGRDECPLVFFHGIGIGWLPYVKWIRKMAKYRRPVVFVELSNIAVELPYPSKPLNMHETVDLVCDILRIPERLGIEKVRQIDILGHSYGTVAASWLVRHTSLVRNLTLVDPVCLQLFRADVCKRFLYSPSALSMVDTFLSHLLQDIGITRTLMRYFDWYDNTLFLEELEEKNVDVEIILSGNDHFVPTKSIAQEISAWKGSRVGLRLFPDYAHGQSLRCEEAAVHIQSCVARREHCKRIK